MAKDVHAVEFAIFATGRGLRFASTTGIVFQWGWSDYGTIYRNDAGYAIPYYAETGWLYQGGRARIVGANIVVGNLLSDYSPAVDAHEIKVELYSDDQASGVRTATVYRDAQQDHAVPPVLTDWALPTLKLNAGVRHRWKWGSLNSAQRIEQFSFIIEQTDGGLEN